MKDPALQDLTQHQIRDELGKLSRAIKSNIYDVVNTDIPGAVLEQVEGPIMEAVLGGKHAVDGRVKDLTRERHIESGQL